MTIAKQKNQTGAGLLTALVLLMLITSIITTVAVIVHYDIRRHRMLRHAASAQGLVDGASMLALDLLMTDSQMSNIDSRSELWAQSLPAYPVNGGVVRAKIRPLSSAFNLYALQLPIQAQRAQYANILRRLVVSLDLSKEVAEKIIAELNSDSKNIVSPTDFLIRLGFIESVTDKLAPYLFYYPVLDGFNINLLDANMWQVIADIDSARANLLVNELKSQPVSDVNAFIESRLKNVAAIKGIVFSVKTRFFEVVTQAKIGDMIRNSVVRVFRVNTTQLVIMQRRSE